MLNYAYLWGNLPLAMIKPLGGIPPIIVGEMLR
jgi:hypothetical protein